KRRRSWRRTLKELTVIAFDRRRRQDVIHSGTPLAATALLFRERELSIPNSTVGSYECVGERLGVGVARKLLVVAAETGTPLRRGQQSKQERRAGAFSAPDKNVFFADLTHFVTLFEAKLGPIR